MGLSAGGAKVGRSGFAPTRRPISAREAGAWPTGKDLRETSGKLRTTNWMLIHVTREVLVWHTAATMLLVGSSTQTLCCVEGFGLDNGLRGDGWYLR